MGWPREQAACRGRSDQMPSGGKWVPESIQGVGTNMCQPDESPDVSGAPPPPPLICETFSDHGAEEHPPNPGAVQKLVTTASLLPQPSLECLDKAADLVKSGG